MAVYRRDLPLFRVVADTSIPGKRARNGTKRIIKATQLLSTFDSRLPVSGTWLGLDIREIIRRNDSHAIKRVFRGRPLPPISRFRNQRSLLLSRYRFVGHLAFVERLIERGSKDEESPLDVLALVPDRF